MAAGTAQLYKDLYGDRADLVHEANELKRQLEEKDQTIARMAEEMEILKKAMHIFSNPKN